MEYKNPFEVLGVTESVDQNQLYEAYKALRNKYADKRFEVGEAGRAACEKLDEIEVAYRDADQILKSRYYEEKFGNPLQEVENLIKNGQFDLAQERLDNMTDHNAEWHYYESIVMFKKQWFNETKKHLEEAIKLEPTNAKYRASLDDLNNHLKEKQQTTQESAYKQAYDEKGNPIPNQGRTYQNTRPQGAGCTPCDCCNGLCAADCCCECLGGDLISCC